MKLAFADVAAVFVSSVSALPGAAIWALVILGFGVAGALLRRREHGVERIGRA